MMNSIKLLFLALVFVGQMNNLFAMEEEADGLYLVVGSCRQEGELCAWSKRLYKSAHQDFSHRNTFNGKATSLDLLPCAIPNLLHIQADARTYKPSAPIKALFLELFPSADTHLLGKEKNTPIKSEENASLLIEKDSYMTICLENLSPYMSPNAQLTIEHEPIMIILKGAPRAYKSFKEYMEITNPFLLCLSPLYMEILECWQLKCALEKKKYFEKIRESLYLENPEEEHTVNYVMEDALLQLSLVDQALDNICAALTPIKREILENRLVNEISIGKKNPIHFDLTKYLMSVVFNEIYHLTYQPQIKTYLENLGFCQIKIGRAVNPYNNRNNSWMISAVKTEDASCLSLS